MNRFCILTILSIISVQAAAQIEATVSGRAMDAQTQQPLPYATVTVTRAPEGLAVTGVLSDAEGRFVISGLPEGRYLVAAGFLGYAPAEMPLVVGGLNEIFDLGDMQLQPSSEAMEEVIATGRQEILETTLDRRIYSMENNLVGAAGSLLDAMTGLPGVTVDQEGRVLLRGSDRVSILVDGRFSSLTGFGNQSGLDSVPAGNVESIEIINNPSAAYDASGMAGIINIVFRQDGEDGLNIDAGLTLGVGTLSKRRQDLPTELGSFSNNQKIIPNFNLSHNTPGRRFFLQSEFLVQDDLPNNEFTTRFYDAGREIMSQVPENRDQEQYIVSS